MHGSWCDQQPNYCIKAKQIIKLLTIVSAKTIHHQLEWQQEGRQVKIIKSQLMEHENWAGNEQQ